MRNKFPGRCETCNTNVAANAGEAVRTTNGWRVRCAAHSNTNPVTAAAQAVLALVIKLWLDGDKLFVSPVSRLGDEFTAYLTATRRAGATFDRAANAQVVSKANAAKMVAELQGAGFTIKAEPELLVELATQKATLSNELQTVTTRANDVDSILNQNGKALMPFQYDGVRWMATRQKAILADEMGLGKTVQALISVPAAAPILVVCPAVAKGVWLREARRFRPDLKVTVISGRGNFQWPTAGEMVVCNFDILPGEKAAKKGYSATLSADLLATAPTGMVLIADEAHALKASDSARTSRFRALRDVALNNNGKVWLLTATPMLNRAPELWAIMQALGAGREVFGSYNNYLKMWNAQQGRYGIEWGNPTPEVARCLKTMMLRRLKCDVLPQLPPKTITDLEVNGLSATVKSLCDETLDALLAAGVNLDKSLAVALATSKSTPAFEMLAKARAALATAKFGAAIELIESYEDAEEPVVVFSAHRAPDRRPW